MNFNSILEKLNEENKFYVIWDNKRDLLWSGTKWLASYKKAKKYNDYNVAEEEAISFTDNKNKLITVKLASEFKDSYENAED